MIGTHELIVFLHYSNICMVFPGGSVLKNLPINAGDVGSIPRLGRSRGRRNDNPLQYSCLEKIPWTEEPVGLQSVKSQTRLSMHTIYVCVCVCVHTVMFDSLWPQELQLTRHLWPWNFSGKNTGESLYIRLYISQTLFRRNKMHKIFYVKLPKDTQLTQNFQRH